VKADAENKKDSPSRIWHLHCFVSHRAAIRQEEPGDEKDNEDPSSWSRGVEEWNTTSITANAQKCLSGVSNLWKLCALPEPVSVNVAAFHQSFPAHDLRYATEYIRRRWADAVILVIGKQAEHLDDPLDDHKVSSGISSEELAGMIDMSATAKRRIMRNVRSGLFTHEVREAGGTA